MLELAESTEPGERKGRGKTMERKVSSTAVFDSTLCSFEAFP